LGLMAAGTVEAGTVEAGTVAAGVMAAGIMPAGIAALGVFLWLEVLDFDLFFGFLRFLHVQVSLVGLFSVCFASVAPKSN
jgi:hypothetical protein